MKDKRMEEAEKAYLKIETVGDRGISIETSGDERGLFVKLALALQSLVISEIISIEHLESIVNTLKDLIKENNLKKGIQDYVDVVDPNAKELQNYKNIIEEYKSSCSAIKRKCLVCPEKDTCKNKQIDIQCNKY